MGNSDLYLLGTVLFISIAKASPRRKEDTASTSSSGYFSVCFLIIQNSIEYFKNDLVKEKIFSCFILYLLIQLFNLFLFITFSLFFP